MKDPGYLYNARQALHTVDSIRWRGSLLGSTSSTHLLPVITIRSVLVGLEMELVK